MGQFLKDDSDRMIRRPMIVCPVPGYRPLLTLACLLVVGTLGCGESEQITRYAVPKETQADDSAAFDVAQSPAMAWFFKLTGPAEAAAAQRENFESLVASTTITGDDADWALPAGWTQQPGSQMRYATLTIGGSDPPLEVSVSKLPLFAKHDEYLLQNINRWRGQLGLSAMSGADGLTQAIAAGEIEQTTTSSRHVTFVNIQGATAEIGDARMLAAIILPPESESTKATMTQPAAPATSAAPPSATAEPLTYQTPEGWQPGKKSMMRVAAFVVADGDKQVEITVIPAGGDLLSNINRWRGQVDLEPWTDDEMKESSEDLTVDGATATYVNLAGTEETILAAILPQGKQSWFFKLRGDPDLAAREVERFKAFVESVHLK